MRSTRGTPCPADTQLEHPRTDRRPVARETEPQAVELNQNPRLRTRIPSFRHPLIERNSAICAGILADLDHRTDRSLQATVGQARTQGDDLINGGHHARPASALAPSNARCDPKPAMRPAERDALYAKWRQAVATAQTFRADAE